MPKHQDLTIFSIDDDEVPLVGYGEVDEYGEITVPTFSTDPTHPRPYLKRVLDFGESTIDFLAGGSLIGQLTVEIVDVPIDEEDQDTGIFTFIAAAASGDTALLGVRMVFREDGEVIFDGVCGPITLSLLTTYRIVLRDIRERERGMPLFNKATETCIFPVVGPTEGWGHTTEYDATEGYVTVGDPVFPRVQGIFAIYRERIGFDSGFLQFAQGFELTIPHKIGTNEESDYFDLLNKFATGSVSGYSDIGDLPHYRFNDLIVEWSPTGLPGTFQRLSHVMETGGLGGFAKCIRFSTTRIAGVDNLYLTHVAFVNTIFDQGEGTVPDPDQGCYIRILSNLPPSEEVPLFLEDRFGMMLKKVYDGDYSRPGTFVPVRYDEARMIEVVERTPLALAIIEKSEDNGREWVQENLYRPASMAPAIRNGKVHPIRYELPDEDEPLTTLDDTNTVTAGWEHGPNNVVNQVIIEYDRDILPTELQYMWQRKSQKIIIEQNSHSDSSQRRHGTRPQIFKPSTIRAVVSEADVYVRTPAQETGGLIALRLGEELLRRFTNGAQIVSAICHRTAEVNALQEGDWVIGAWSWLPNYVTRTRGMNRLLQVVAIRRTAPHLREFILVDAGPHDQPIEQPTVGALEENENGSVDIPVTDVPVGGKAEVQYALGETQPDVNSGEWRTVAYLTEDGVARTLPFLWPARLVWARARGTQRGRRASAWTTPVSLRLSDQAILRDFTLEVIKDSNSADYGRPLVKWDRLTGTGGIRVKYAVHAPFSDPPTYEDLDFYQDFDADDGEGVLDLMAIIESDIVPIDLRQWERVTVQVIAYPGFAAGVVTGDPGAFSALRTVARIEDHYVKPTIGEIVDRLGFTGRLRLEIIDQQLTITSVWFRTRTGNDEDSWTEFTEDPLEPFIATIGIVPSQSSAIGYEVYARDHAGIERLFKSGTVEFPYEGPAGLFLQVTEVSGPDPDNFIYLEARAIDPSPQGTDTITLKALEGAPAQVTDPTDITTIGVPTGVVTSDFATTGMVEVTVQRPQYVGGLAPANGHLLLWAEASGRSNSPTVRVEIPREPAPEESVFFNNASLSVVRDDMTNDILNFDVTITAGSPDHIALWIKRNGDMDFFKWTDDATSIDTNMEWGWNLERIGTPPVLNKSMQYYIVAYDADNNVIGQSDESAVFNFDAYPDS